MDDTIGEKYHEVLDALSFLRDILYNTKTIKEESRQEELVTQAEQLIQEALTLYEKTRGKSR